MNIKVATSLWFQDILMSTCRVWLHFHRCASFLVKQSGFLVWHAGEHPHWACVVYTVMMLLATAHPFILTTRVDIMIILTAASPMRNNRSFWYCTVDYRACTEQVLATVWWGLNARLDSSFIQIMAFFNSILAQVGVRDKDLYSADDTKTWTLWLCGNIVPYKAILFIIHEFQQLE